MPTLRTPEDRFRDLPGFDYAPSYLDDLPGYSGLRTHYLDEGPRAAREVFLCLHGEPTWSYLYRKMIPVFTCAGHRVVAPDFLSFRRSHTPPQYATYACACQPMLLTALIERLELGNMSLGCQDWSGRLRLALPVDMADRVAGRLVMNTALGTGDIQLTKGFLDWRAYVARTPDIDC